MGFTFKENCSDIRNTRITYVINELKKVTKNIDVHDPLVLKEDKKKLKKLNFVNIIKLNYYDSIIITVSHKIFKQYGIKKIKNFCKKNHIIFDLKHLFK